MKKIILWMVVCMIGLAGMSCSRPDYKKAATDFISSATSLKDYTIREVADTSSSGWKAVIVYVKQGKASVPAVFFVSSDGKSVVPNSMVFVNGKPIFDRKLEPELGRIDFKLADKDRNSYNPSGKKTIFMFTDPDCPYCQKARAKLQDYNGEYRVIIKYFPLEQIHPGATRKAIAEEAAWLKKTRPDLARETDALREAERMVQEDIAEAKRAEVSGVPMYVMEDGTLKQGLF